MKIWITFPLFFAGILLHQGCCDKDPTTAKPSTFVSIESTKSESATAFQATTVQVGDTDGNMTAQETLDQISVIHATIELLSDDAVTTLNSTTLENGTEIVLASENPIFDPISEATGLARDESTGSAPTTTKSASTANPIVVTKRIPKFGCDGKTNIVVGIHTVPSAYEDRKWIRKTWAKDHSSSTTVFFVIGRNSHGRNHMQVLAEHRNYGDILLVGIEAYEKNLTIKTYGFFEYVLQHCSNVKRVVKAEKDTVVNLSSLEKLSFDNLAGKITGSISRNNGYQDSVNGTWMISGESSIRELQTLARTKTHVLTSETYQNNPDAFYTGFVRDLAKLEIQNIECFKNQTSYWLATSRDRRDEIWARIKSAPQP